MGSLIVEGAKARIDAFRKVQKDYQEALEKDGKAVLAALFAEFFENNPSVYALTWTQYTPYFNDGDTCEFSVHDLYAAFPLKLENGEDNPEAEGYDDDVEVGDVECGSKYISSYQDEDMKYVGYREMHKTFRELSDVCEATFGDHVQVIATREGFQVDEYSHD
jgi:hypothetical protein